MRLKIFLILFLIYSFKIEAQTAISGNVSNENEVALSGVLVVNINNDNQTLTDQNGYFLINAKSGNELRFIRQNYERVVLKLRSENFYSTVKLEMKYLPKDIEVVVLNYKPTGILKEDIKHFGAPKKNVELNKDLGKYNHAYSSREIMKPKRGEFVQPKGPGFETTKIGYQWTILDLQIYLEKTLTNNYFKSMGLEEYEIFPFIGFTLKTFENKEIRRFGRVTSSDLARFQAEAERQILLFKSKSEKKQILIK